MGSWFSWQNELLYGKGYSFSQGSAKEQNLVPSDKVKMLVLPNAGEDLM